MYLFGFIYLKQKSIQTLWTKFWQRECHKNDVAVF